MTKIAWRIAFVFIGSLGSFASVSPALAQIFDLGTTETFATELKPEDSAVGDFNNDGDLDIAVGNTYFNQVPDDGSVSVYLGIGNGSFTGPVHHSVGDRPEGVTTGRFNNDNFDDIATADFTGGSISVMISDGTGGFTISSFAIPEPARHVAAFLADGDGFDDLVTANFDDDTVSVFHADGAGDFDFEETISVGDGAETVRPANLDNGGGMDFVVICATPGSDGPDVYFLENDGDGTFTVASNLNFTVEDEARNAAVMDLNNDNFDDLVVSFWGTNDIAIVENNTDGSFTVTETFDLGLGRPIFVSFGDLNNDSTADLIISYFTTDTVAIVEGLGGFSFDTGSGQPQELTVDDSPYSTAVVDFNGDGKNDFYVANTNEPNMQVFLADSAVTPPAAFIDSITPNPALTTQTVDFVGHGEPQGEITVFDWSSDIDGTLSSQTSFSRAPGTLSTGSHIITLRVENAGGDFDIATSPLTVNTPPDPPTATIVSVSPNPAQEGQNVVFTGQGLPGGTITAFLWRSDLVGPDLSTQESFQTSTLPVGIHDISFRVENASGNDTANIMLEIEAAPPGPPTANIVSVTPNPAEEGQAVTFTGEGLPAGSITAFLWRSDLVGPDLSTQESFQTSSLPVGTHDISFRVENASGNDTASVMVEIQATAPDPPTASIISMTPNPAQEGQAVTFTGEGLPAGTITAFLWRSDQVGPDLSTQESFQTSSLPVGTHSITFRVENASGNDTAMGVLEIEAAPPAPPTANIVNITPNPAEVGETVTLTGEGLPAGTITSFLWRSDLVGSDLSTQESFQTSTLPQGTHSITFRVENASGNDTAVAALEVVEPQPTAVLVDISPNPARRGENVTFTGDGLPEASITSYLWRSDLVGGDLSTQESFSTTTLPGGTHTITLRVENSSGNDTAVGMLEVQPELEAFIQTITPNPATETEEVQFVGAGEPAADIASFRWTSDLVPGTLSSQAAFSLTTLPIGNHTITLRVEDAEGRFDETEVMLEVQTATTPPEAIIDSILPSPVTEGEEVAFMGSGSPPEDITGFLWRSDLVGANLSTQATFSRSDLPAGTHTISLSVTNSDGESSDNVEQVLVVKERPVATIESISPNPADEEQSVSFVGSGTPAVDIDGYRWRSSRVAGDLSSSASFSNSTLPPGPQTIFFSVRNDLGVWSDEVTDVLDVVPIAREEIIQDTSAPGVSYTGFWYVSSGPNSFGEPSLYCSEPGSTFTYNVDVAEDGRYDVFLRWTTFNNRRSDVPVTVTHADGSTEVTVDQTQNAAEWVQIGTWDVEGTLRVQLTSRGLGMTTCVDGLRVTGGGS